VSAKFTPEICINNASSYRLRAAGRQATVADTTLRTVSRLFFFSLLTFDEKTTELHLHAEKLIETVLHFTWDTLWVFFVCVSGFVLFFVTPLMRQLQNNI
jgi:hypothetical protein